MESGGRPFKKKKKERKNRKRKEGAVTTVVDLTRRCPEPLRRRKLFQAATCLFR